MVIGLLVCEVLEAEMLHLITGDPDLQKVTFIESDPGACLIQGLRSRMVERLQVLQSVNDFEPDPSLSYELLAKVLRVGLHMDKELLQEGVISEGQALASKSDVLLLGYGLCGNVLLDIETRMTDAPCPIVLPENLDGSRIDDCVCMVLGGTEKYLEQVYKEAGTWFVTPGWLKHWETLLVKELRCPDIETVKWIFDKTGYTRCLMVKTGIEDYDTFRAETDKFSELFKFRVEEVEGTLNLLRKSFEQAKNVAVARKEVMHLQEP